MYIYILISVIYIYIKYILISVIKIYINIFILQILHKLHILHVYIYIYIYLALENLWVLARPCLS